MFSYLNLNEFPQAMVGDTNIYAAVEPEVSEDEVCCGNIIPHFELRQVRENLGLNEAQRGRYGRGAGEGDILMPDYERLSGTQQTQHGPVPLSDPLFSGSLYNQGFTSLSAVPNIFIGVFTDPVTGQEYDAYESALPPPNTDYEETLNSQGRNRKLAQLQGGWSDTTPRPTKTEVVEDDFNMHYDRTIRSFGTYDARYYQELANQRNQLNLNDYHPDSTGAIQEGLPANMLGNQGVVRIRSVPYVVPTNRGRWGEHTFRSGIDPCLEAAGGGDQRLEYTYTTQPYVRAENSRIDGGGIEATRDTQAFVNQYEHWEAHDTQRSASENKAQYMGPVHAGYGVSEYGVVPAPLKLGGVQTLGQQGLGPITYEHNAPILVNQEYTAPEPQTGLETQPAMFSGATLYSGGKNMSELVQKQNTKSELKNALDIGVSGNEGLGGHLDGGVRTAADKTKRQAYLSIHSAFDTAMGNYVAQSNQALRTRFNDKSGRLVDFTMPGKTLAGVESLYVNGQQSFGNVGRVSSKREAFTETTGGIYAPSDNIWQGVYSAFENRKENDGWEGMFQHDVASATMALGLRDGSENVGL